MKPCKLSIGDILLDCFGDGYSVVIEEKQNCVYAKDIYGNSWELNKNVLISQEAFVYESGYDDYLDGIVRNTGFVLVYKNDT